MKAHQQANTKMAHMEVSEKLVLMGGQNGGDGFDFENEGVFAYTGSSKPGKTVRCTSMPRPMILALRVRCPSMKNSRGIPWSSVFSVVNISEG